MWTVALTHLSAQILSSHHKLSGKYMLAITDIGVEVAKK